MSFDRQMCLAYEEEVIRLNKVLIQIRDSTHTSAVVLRGIANNALSNRHREHNLEQGESI
jgi:hypothetical protein